LALPQGIISKKILDPIQKVELFRFKVIRGNDEMENRARLEISSEFWMKRTITTTTEPKNEVWKASKRQ
jgi:hypothetical protein